MQQLLLIISMAAAIVLLWLIQPWRAWHDREARSARYAGYGCLLLALITAANTPSWSMLKMYLFIFASLLVIGFGRRRRRRARAAYHKWQTAPRRSPVGSGI